MSTSTNVATGVYIYAFVRANQSTGLSLPEVRGIDQAPIFSIQLGTLSAIVSATEAKKIRPQRKNLAAHQEIVTNLARSFDMLPVAFGLIADDSAQVERVLHSHQVVLLEQIERVAGQLEMSVSLRWSCPNIFQYFIDRSQELKAAREAIASGNASRDEQIAMGQMFEQLLTSERQRHTETFTSVLEPVCKEIDVQPARDEADCMRLACLIPRNGEQVFTDAVYSAASRFSDEYAVTFNGPWPPYSFVKLAIGLE